MPFILGISKPLPLEDVPQMPAAVVAHNLGPHHAQTRIGPLSNSVREGVPEGGPPAPRVELVVGLVKRCFAASAGVDTLRRHVLVKVAAVGRLGALFAENAELLYTKRLEDCRIATRQS